MSLLDKLAKDAEKKASVSDPKKQNDMLDGDVKNIDTDTVEATPPTVEELEKAQAKSKQDETDNSSEDNPYENWTDKDFQNALKKARAEAAKNRVKAKDLEEQKTAEIEKVKKELEEIYAPLKQKAEQLDKLKEQEADKKRTQEEKLADREAKIAKLQAELADSEQDNHQKMVDLQERLQELQSTVEAHESYYKEQLEKERSEIPSQWDSVADAMIAGAKDTREALNLLRDAKRKNLFGNKKVEVFHNTPNKASEGRPLSSKKVQEDQKNDMDSKAKIKAGLTGLISEVKQNKTKFGI